MWQVYYSGVPPTPPTALIHWEGVLVVATVALLVTVGGWLLLNLMRCSFHRCRGLWASSRGKKKQLSTLPSTQKPSALERLARLLLRRAGPFCALMLALVLTPTALQLRRVLQQDEIIDTDSVHTRLKPSGCSQHALASRVLPEACSSLTPPPPLPAAAQSRPSARSLVRTQIDLTSSGCCCWIPMPLCSMTLHALAPCRASVCAVRRVSPVGHLVQKSRQWKVLVAARTWILTGGTWVAWVALLTEDMLCGCREVGFGKQAGRE